MATPLTLASTVVDEGFCIATSVPLAVVFSSLKATPNWRTSSARAEQKVVVIIGLENCNMLSPLVFADTYHQAVYPAGGPAGL
jgi:hypothetical protein